VIDSNQTRCSFDATGLRPRHFTLTVLAALGVGLAAAVVMAPLAAMAVAAAGWRFPFPRVFDRTVMVTVFCALALCARRLGLWGFLRQSFSPSRRHYQQAIAGLALATAAMAVLFSLAAIASGKATVLQVFVHALAYLPAAIVIGLLEEGFFRAFLLGGMEGDIGSLGALLASSAIFALIHILRSPARFYLTGLHPAAGAEVLLASAARIGHPQNAAALWVGLFLLALVLGEAFLLTRRVYCSIGLHAGFVLGAKTWRLTESRAVPWWLAGTGPVGLLAAPAAWAIAMILLAVLPLCLGVTRGVPRHLGPTVQAR
jgi:membrane protease YdiL (CAAX protease family)